MTIIVPEDAKRSGRNKRMRPVRPSATTRRQYTEALQAQADLLKAATANLSDYAQTGATRQRVGARLDKLMRTTQDVIDRVSKSVASSFVGEVSDDTKKRTEANLADALGVDLVRVIDDDPQILAALTEATNANVALIKSIGQEHWGKVAEAVLDNYKGATEATPSLIDRLQQLGGITRRRAGVIARDQTSKVTGALNQVRQTGNGIGEYIWRTAKDQRVVGNPTGLYPVGSAAHHNHFEREGRTFRWNDPPEDGHPGEAILCRCYAEPVLNLENLKAKYV